MSNANVYFTLLDTSNKKNIRDPLWNTIYLDRRLNLILLSPAMQKLTRIQQLGPTSLVYPGATHTRFSHSIGVYHIARLIILHLLVQEETPLLTQRQVNSFLAAALLHDIGHFPYTHCLKELPLPEHETLSSQLIIQTLAPLLVEADCDPILCAAIISPDLYEINTNDKEALVLFSQLLSGAMDPDKLDYLCRDAFFAGVPYGIQDIQHAIRQIKISKSQEGMLEICFSSMLPVENIQFSKYLMYSSVYWHKKVRCATAMVKYSLYHAMEKGHISSEELISLDDIEFTQLCQKIEEEYMHPARLVHRGELYDILFEDDFDETYSYLENIIERTKKEHILRKKFSFAFLIIDLPEAISFEINNKSDSVFSEHMMKSFVRNIRKLRIFVPRDEKHEISHAKIHELLKNK